MSSGVVVDERIAWSSLAAPVGVAVFGALPAFLVGALAVQVRQELQFGEVQLGALLTAFGGICALASLVAGRVVERIGAATAILASTSLVATASLGTAVLADSWGDLLAFTLVAGLGNAGAHPAANLALARSIPPRRQGLAFGIKQASIPASIFLAGLSVPLVGLTVGWRWAFAGCGALSLAVGLVAFLGREGDGSATVPRLERVRLGPLLLVAALVFFALAGVQAVATFLVEFGASTGIDPGRAGLVLAAASLVGMAMRIGSGWAADRGSGRRLLTAVSVYLMIGACGLVVLGFLSGLAWFAFGTLVGLGAGWSWNGLLHFAVVRSHLEAPAAATSIVQAGVFGGAAVGPLVFGALVETVSYQAAWLAAAASMVVAAGLAVAAGRRLGT